jgi:DNA polymerase-4/DNA polymerase IV (DinB-like DNA polymerase)
MSIKDAYRLCPGGIYMHPNIHKYVEASRQIHKIWLTYSDIIEFISLDEGFLDVTASAAIFGGAVEIGRQIKTRTKAGTGLTCSVGIGYSMMSAKLASEEKKPDGFFELTSPEALRELIIDRNVRIIYGLGPKTAEKLQASGINTVRDLLANKQTVVGLLDSHGRYIIDLAEGRDDRRVTPYEEGSAKSLGREFTFQHDITDFDFLKDVIRYIAREISLRIRLDGLYARTVTLKVKYANMKLITRAKSGDATNNSTEIYKTAAAMLDAVDKRPIRLVGVSLSGFTESSVRQMTLDDISRMTSIKMANATVMKSKANAESRTILKNHAELEIQANAESRKKMDGCQILESHPALESRTHMESHPTLESRISLESRTSEINSEKSIQRRAALDKAL